MDLIVACSVARDGENEREDYNARENARAARMRRYIASCPTCASPIYEDPGYCVQCAWDGQEVTR
jgi:hypothetical protein